MQVGTLKGDVIKCYLYLILDKCLLDVSTAQASDLMAAKTLDEKEKKILRSAVQELQMRDEHSLIIGKLRQQILALESSEIRSYQKLESLNSKCLEYESKVLEVLLSLT